jgi:hypothetical protein
LDEKDFVALDIYYASFEYKQKYKILDLLNKVCIRTIKLKILYLNEFKKVFHFTYF